MQPQWTNTCKKYACTAPSCLSPLNIAGSLASLSRRTWASQRPPANSPNNFHWQLKNSERCWWEGARKGAELPQSFHFFASRRCGRWRRAWSEMRQREVEGGSGRDETTTSRMHGTKSDDSKERTREIIYILHFWNFETRQGKRALRERKNKLISVV